MTIEDVLAKLDPKLRKHISIGDEIQVTKLATPSYGLNRALRGGFAYGRQVLIWGNKSAGKSSFCLQLIAEAQREGKIVAWIDAEDSYDPMWASRLGVDTSKLLYSNVKSINGMVDIATQLMTAKVDVIVVDSISALLPGVYFEKDSDNLKDLADTKQIGAESRDMSNAVKMLNYANDKTLLIFISQQRNQFGSLYVSHIPTGGHAVKFFSSTIVKLWSSDSDNNAIKGQITVGNKIIEEKIGREVTWHIDFNKTGPAFLSGKYDFYFGGDIVGIDRVGDLFDTAELMGLVEKGGAWYKFMDQSFQGRAKAIEWLRQNPDAIEKLRAML